MTPVICPNKEIALLTVALYSVSQDCFHIEKLHEYISLNIRNALHLLDNGGYKMIGIFNNDIEADKYIEVFRKKIDEIRKNKN